METPDLEVILYPVKIRRLPLGPLFIFVTLQLSLYLCILHLWNLLVLMKHLLILGRNIHFTGFWPFSWPTCFVTTASTYPHKPYGNLHMHKNNVKRITVETKRMAIANGTCVNFCNQPKAHYLATVSYTHLTLPTIYSV